MGRKEGKTLVFASRVTRTRFAARAAGSIALAAVIVVSEPGTAFAQAPATDRTESESQEAEQPAENTTPSAPASAETQPEQRAKQPAKPFTPTERIEAESVVAFPANI